MRPRMTWRRGAYAVGLALAAGVAACIVGIPLQLNDFLVMLLEVQPVSTGQIFVERMLATNYIRPLFWVERKLLLELGTATGGHYFAVFKAVHVLQVVATVWLCVRLMRVRTSIDFAAAAVALAVLLGLHTMLNAFREGPMTAIFCAALAANLALSETRRRWHGVAAVALLVYAALSVELGLLVWVVYVAAFAAGARGLSVRAVAASTVFTAGYFAFRFLVLDSGDSGLTLRDTGVGLAMRAPDELASLFGGNRLVLYAHNVVTAGLSVLFSEPRAGEWVFVRRALEGSLAPWLWINLASSVLATAVLGWFAWRRRARWLRPPWSHEERLVLVFGVVLAANAALSLAYNRDVIMSPAGMFYAVAVYVALREALGALPTLRIPTRAAAAAVLVVLSLAWTTRTIGTTYVLRDTAADKRNQWATAVELLAEWEAEPADDAGWALVHQLRQEALATPVPQRPLAQLWAERYFDRSY